MSFDEMIVKVFKAMGHPIRYEIVKFLIDEPKCVCKLNQNIRFSQSNLSQHLKILKEAGILKSEKRGLNTFYSVSSEQIKEIIKSAENLINSYIKNI